ncbi:hypothetical protein HAX54_001235 [Datura stramonium]|uniref:Uncharacterized protein n=1 Tax=Datura stramonium TaxID=4076 RepID=A0ABS8T231_DATST|nr:hypothetical protein [Datura stramonium]
MTHIGEASKDHEYEGVDMMIEILWILTHNLCISNQDFKRDLHQNLNVDDLRVRHRIMQTIQKMIDYVGRYFIELGRVVTQLRHLTLEDCFMLPPPSFGGFGRIITAEVDLKFFRNGRSLELILNYHRNVRTNKDCRSIPSEDVEYFMGQTHTLRPHLWNEIEMRRKEKESRKKMMQNKESGADSDGKNEKQMMLNKKSGVDSDEKKGKDQCGSVEKMVLDKDQQKDIFATKLGATTDNVNDNAGQIGTSSGPKTVHESAVEPVKEDIETSHHEQNDIVRSRSQEK